MTGEGLESAKLEVQNSIERLFYWAAFSDKYGGEVKETPVAAPVVSETVEEAAAPRGRSRGRCRREGDAQTAEEGAE